MSPRLQRRAWPHLTGDMVEHFPEPGWKVLDFTTLADQPGFSGP